MRWLPEPHRASTLRRERGLADTNRVLSRLGGVWAARLVWQGKGNAAARVLRPCARLEGGPGTQGSHGLGGNTFGSQSFFLHLETAKGAPL